VSMKMFVWSIMWDVGWVDVVKWLVGWSCISGALSIVNILKPVSYVI